MTSLHTFINTNPLLYVPVHCRSSVVEVLQILSRIRCNDSIMAIAEKYHYEDVIYSHQLLNQETLWTTNAVEWKVDQTANIVHCHFESNCQRHWQQERNWVASVLWTRSNMRRAMRAIMMDSIYSTMVRVRWRINYGPRKMGYKLLKETAKKNWGEYNSPSCHF